MKPFPLLSGSRANSACMASPTEEREGEREREREREVVVPGGLLPSSPKSGRRAEEGQASSPPSSQPHPYSASPSPSAAESMGVGWVPKVTPGRVGGGGAPGSPPARARAPPGSRGGGRGVPTPHPPLHLRGAPSTQGPSDHPPPSCPCSPFCHLVRSTRKESLLSSSLLSREPTGECAADRRLRGKGRATPVAEGKERRRRLFGGEKGAWRKGGGRRGGRGRLGGKKSIRG